MPILLAKLLTFFATSFVSILAVFVGRYWALRIAGALSIAAVYVACVAYYTTMIGPWLAGIFSTQYGALLGLLFPPVAGSVTAAMGLYYTCIAGKRYTSKVLKIAMG